MLSGISPDSWFAENISWLRFLMLPTSEGSCPVSELYDKSKNLERRGSLKISLGIEPFRRLLDRSRAIRFFSFPKLAGIAPIKTSIVCI
ncbi:hypothetical protein GQ55_1G171900 [Panicum hallii var. hallii]|uniref:Uncharacterized protein n=1 Tax=Panicum hallii var. hallii TaxID=1504633 RepID=A0A2T7F5W8_9POAL|nr:hypothetical protein GQ55_1G171900 [Panicum hallii var. hallii]